MTIINGIYKDVKPKKRNKLMNIIAITSILTLGAFTSKPIINMIKTHLNETRYLTSEDFQKAKWLRYDNKKGEIWSAYKQENINLNQINWYAYEKEVRKKNPNGLEGQIFLPDLDGNGKVGK